MCLFQNHTTGFSLRIVIAGNNPIKNNRNTVQHETFYFKKILPFLTKYYLNNIK